MCATKPPVLLEPVQAYAMAIAQRALLHSFAMESNAASSFSMLWTDTCNIIHSWPERTQLASLVQTWALTAWAKRRCCWSCYTWVGVVRLALQQAHQMGVAALQK